MKINYPERGKDIHVGNVEIVMDSGKPGTVEIYMLDTNNNRIEGGDFDLGAFIEVVLDFYNREY
jgi:hypothetical protein